ncbi:MAG TPA: purine-nucleoside phosphorylase, partial [Bacteroidetes bacterium]|nr:purine-nucleoside phosphorylase [Bacteroidota bacterium]
MQAPQANIDINLLKTATAHVQEALPDIPETAIILGSGLGYLADSLSNSSAIDTGSIPGYPASTVEGHKGRWVVGENRDGVRLLAVQGRIHGYEGHPHRVVTFPI